MTVQDIDFKKYIPNDDGLYFVLDWDVDPNNTSITYYNPSLVRVKVIQGDPWIQYSECPEPPIKITPKTWHPLAMPRYFSKKIQEIKF